MTLEQVTKLLSPLVNEWPMGELVWNRANARRGVIVGYQVHADNSASLRVDYGGEGMHTEMPVMLSAAPVAEGGDGEDWKQGERS